jgi:hypothetical protein
MKSRNNLVERLTEKEAALGAVLLKSARNRLP